jgi:hypothetical protein
MDKTNVDQLSRIFARSVRAFASDPSMANFGATASPFSPSTRRENSQPRRRRTMARCDAAAEEGDQVRPPDRCAAGPAIGSRPHTGPAPAHTAARARHRLRDRAGRLHARELEGESAATPAIILAEVVLFLIPIFLTMAALTFAAYYLSR